MSETMALLAGLVNERDRTREQINWVLAHYEAMVRIADAAIDRLTQTGDLDGIAWVRAVAEEHIPQ